MKKQVLKEVALVLLGIVVGCGSLLGQRAEDSDQNTLLWKINGQGIKASYIYGTIHMICPDDFFLSEATKSAFSDADQVVMELDMDDPALMTKIQQLSLNQNMENLSTKLTEEELAVVNGYLKKHYGADLSQFGVMRPFALLSMMLLKSIDCPQPSSYEHTFVQMAKEENKEVLGLETAEFQFGIFNNASQEDQLSWLVEYAEDPEAMKAEFNEMLAAYKAQDLNEMHELMTRAPQYADLMEALLYERNQNWISKIEELAAEKSTFFAVGAGHLASDRGVIQLLKDAGFVVVPVTD